MIASATKHGIESLYMIEIQFWPQVIMYKYLIAADMMPECDLVRHMNYTAVS